MIANRPASVVRAERATRREIAHVQMQSGGPEHARTIVGDRVPTPDFACAQFGFGSWKFFTRAVRRQEARHGRRRARPRPTRPLLYGLTLSFSTVSQRLRILRSEGLIVRRRAGNHIYYSLADRHVADLIHNGLAHASKVAAEPAAYSQEGAGT